MKRISTGDCKNIGNLAVNIYLSNASCLSADAAFSNQWKTLPDCHCAELQKRNEELEEFVRIVGEGDCALPDLTERCYCITCSARKLTPSSEEVCK